MSDIFVKFKLRVICGLRGHFASSRPQNKKYFGLFTIVTSDTRRQTSGRLAPLLARQHGQLKRSSSQISRVMIGVMLNAA
jgi:hypothetical protein